MKSVDCIIVGAGPAGILSAVQLKRLGFSVLLFEDGKVGGLLRNARFVENYLGFPEGVTGENLARFFEAQLKRFKIDPIPEEVLEVSKKRSGYQVQTNKNDYQTKTVVIATGTSPLKAGLKGEDDLAGKKLFYHVIDIPESKKSKKILIVGGGDAGFDYALNLHDQGHEPTIITQGKIKCIRLLKRGADVRDISYFEGVNPKEVKPSGRGIELACNKQKFTADYVLVAVGREPRLPHIRGKGKGIHFAGDVHNDFSRQVHIAAGDALTIAMKIAHDLSP